MTFINEFTTYCAICGGPVTDPDVRLLSCSSRVCTDHRYQIDESWLSQVVLLHSSTEFPNKEIQELPAKNTGGPYFELLSNFEAVTACDKSSSVVPSPKPLYIACHQKCVSLAKRCMASQETASKKSVEESMQHLWLVLVKLFERASEEKMRPVCNIYNAQAYGDIWRFQELVWERSSDPETRSEAMVIIIPLHFLAAVDTDILIPAFRSRSRRCIRHNDSDPLTSRTCISDKDCCIFRQTT